MATLAIKCDQCEAMEDFLYGFQVADSDLTVWLCYRCLKKEIERAGGKLYGPEDELGKAD